MRAAAGPDRGGRSLASSGVKGRPNEAYFGAVGGGLWKTSDKGETWTPVTDGQITSSSVGALAVSESSPDIVFIGTGESCIRGNIMPGDGVYRSADAGLSAAPAMARLMARLLDRDEAWIAAEVAHYEAYVATQLAGARAPEVSTPIAPLPSAAPLPSVA